ncbi:hypothetical protein LEADMM271B_02690 [Leclercia adecarboxylata]
MVMINNNKAGVEIKKSRAEDRRGLKLTCCFILHYLEFLRLSQNRNSLFGTLKAR